MVSLSYILTVLLCTSMFLFFLRKWRRRGTLTSGTTPMPSPPKLPVVGNLHQLGSLPHRSLQSLSRRYGPLMLLHFGRVPVVVVSSAEAAREVMKNQDLTFSNRPRMSIPARLLYNYRDVAFTPYGDYWRQVRNICVTQLLSNRRVQSYRRVREEETSMMVEKMMETPVVNLSDVLATLTNDVVCRVALGKKYGDVRSFKNIITEFGQLLAALPLWEYIPWLNWTRRFDGLDGRIERVAKALDEFLEAVIQEHRVRDGDHDGDGGLDFVDILLEFQRENDSVENDTIKALLLDTFAAGTDTVVTLVEWAMTELIRNPRAMKALQKEVRESVESNGEVKEEDLEKMPYLKAVIKESLRLHAPVPLLVPRESTRDTKVMGFDIASGMRVVINAWAIGRDPTSWDDPEEFLLERFLDTSIDYKGLHFELIPFGAGRRGCPGIAFGVAVDELAIAKLVHKFDFGLPNGVKMEELDISESNGLSVHKRLPLLVIATPHVCC